MTTSGDQVQEPVRATEVEAKFEVRSGFVLPDLTPDVQDGRLPGVARLGEPRQEDLDATYFDGPDLPLARAGVVLRRRTGGTDAGWHLKLPAAAAQGVDTDGVRSRQEVRLPAGRSGTTVPAALLSQLQVHLRGARPEPVVRLHTDRTVTPLLGEDGAVLAELAHDQVAATLLRPAPDGAADDEGSTVLLWSELEAELSADAGPAGPPLLRALAARLAVAGLRPATQASKLQRALVEFHLIPAPAADEGPETEAAAPRRSPAERAEALRRPGRTDRSAAAVVLAHLADQVASLERQDPGVRVDAPDAVHQMRVATRRLRSALATFRPLFDRTVTDPLRDELQWLGEVLGAARDAEVVRDHLTRVLAAEPGDLVLGPVAERIAATMSTRHRTAHDAVVAALDGDRYHRLLDALDALVNDPPPAPAAAGRRDAVLLPLVSRTWKRMVRLQAQAEQAAADPAAGREQRDHLLHELRKAAKRARYAGEAVAPTYGRQAKAWARRMEAVQEVLGEHQDSVVVREHLRAMAVAAYLDGENAFTFGRLHALEQARAGATERDHRPAWDAAAAKPGRRWLKA